MKRATANRIKKTGAHGGGSFLDGDSKTTSTRTLAIIVVVVLVIAIAIVAGVEAHKRYATREAFLSWGDWNPTVKGRVGEQGVMNDAGQQDVLADINEKNNSTSSCEPGGVTMPPEWRPTDQYNECALAMTNFAVRNNCSAENPLLGDDSVVRDVYIHPDTLKCNVAFRSDADKMSLEAYKDKNNISFKLREVQRLKQRVKQLENQILNLERQIQELREEIADQEREIESLRGKERRLKNRIDELEQEKQSIETDIAALQRQINKVQRSQKRVQNIGKGVIQPGGAHRPLDTISSRSKSEFPIMDSSTPDATSLNIGDQWRQEQLSSNGADGAWEKAPFDHVVFLQSGKTPDLDYKIRAPVTSKYRIEAWTVTGGGNTDSFYVSLDGSRSAWHTGRRIADWNTWRTVDLSKGDHSLVFSGRELSGLGALRVSRV